jgi:hypothetical protein
LSIARRPSGLSFFATMPLPTAFYLLGARGTTFPSNRIADIFLICFIVFFGPIFCLPSPWLGLWRPPEFYCLRKSPHLLISADDRMRAQCASVAHWPGRANMQALHTGLRSCFKLSSGRCISNPQRLTGRCKLLPIHALKGIVSRARRRRGKSSPFTRPSCRIQEHNGKTCEY